MNNSLENIFFRNNRFHVFNKIISLIDLVILKIVNDQIESSFGNNIDQRGKHLQSILSSSENNKVVSQQIVILEHISTS